MAASYRIEKERRLVTTTAYGVVTEAEAFQHQDSLLKDNSFHPDFYQLMDLTGVTKIEIDSNAIRRLAARDVFSANSRRAIVVNNPVGFGLVRMFEAYRDIAGGQERLQIFENSNEALKWLFSPEEAD